MATYDSSVCLPTNHEWEKVYPFFHEKSITLILVLSTGHWSLENIISESGNEARQIDATASMMGSVMLSLIS